MKKNKKNHLEEIIVVGARDNNLNNINVNLPRNKLIVITGLSGSGKSTLAFDTIYSEGQRRYVESLSTYARQFLGGLKKPKVDHIFGLSPAISIQQKSVSKNPRSTVGTITEIYDYLRLLYSRIGKQKCYKCNGDVSNQTVQQIVDKILKLPLAKLLVSISGSAVLISSSLSLRLFISQIVFNIRQNKRKTPACQVRRPVEDIAQTADDIAIRIGTSLLTILLLTFNGVIRELIPRTTRILKILLPITLLAARASLPLKTEFKLTKSSGELVPKDTTVSPITI